MALFAVVDEVDAGFALARDDVRDRRNRKPGQRSVARLVKRSCSCR
jgi:hypothetical protein